MPYGCTVRSLIIVGEFTFKVLSDLHCEEPVQILYRVGEHYDLVPGDARTLVVTNPVIAKSLFPLVSQSDDLTVVHVGEPVKGFPDNFEFVRDIRVLDIPIVKPSSLVEELGIARQNYPG